MRQLLIVVVCVVVCVVAISVITADVAFASATAAQPTQTANLFSWATSSPIQWVTGILYAILGLTGALITMFATVGGAVPGTAGKADIDEDTERLRRFQRKVENMLNEPDIQPDRVQAVEQCVNDLQKSIQLRQRNQWWIAGFIYVVLGIIIAAALAQNLLQAVAIGAGWTGVIGTLGLKSDYEERKSKKDTELTNLLSRIDHLEGLLNAGQKQELNESSVLRSTEQVQRDVNVVKAL